MHQYIDTVTESLFTNVDHQNIFEIDMSIILRRRASAGMRPLADVRRQSEVHISAHHDIGTLQLTPW